MHSVHTINKQCYKFHSTFLWIWIGIKKKTYFIIWREIRKSLHESIIVTKCTGSSRLINFRASLSLSLWNGALLFAYIYLILKIMFTLSLKIMFTLILQNIHGHPHARGKITNLFIHTMTVNYKKIYIYIPRTLPNTQVKLKN